MIRRNKAFSIVMTLCLCLALLAPVFVAPPAAEASSSYQVLSAPTVTTGNVVKDLGVIKVTLHDTAIAAYSIVTVSLPSDLTFTANGDTRPAGGAAAGTVPVAGAAGAGITVVASGVGADELAAASFDAAGTFAITPNNTFDIKMGSQAAIAGDNPGTDKYFYIYFNGIDLNNYNGDVKVTMYPPSGSAFSSAMDLVVGKTTSTGSTLTTCKKVVDLTDAGGTLDIITVNEESPGTFTGTDNIKLEILTNGFKFNTAAATDAASYGWDFGNNAVIPGNLDPIAAGWFSSNDQLLTYNVRAGVAAINTPGRISFVNLDLVVDDTKAKPGDEVEIKVSGTNVTTQTFAVATYVDYGVTVEEGTVKELIAGQSAQEIGEFYIKEGAAASLLNNRIVSFTLPTGCEWNVVNTGDYTNTTNGSVTFNGAGSNYPTLTDSNRVLKWEVTTQSASAAKIKFSDFKIDVSPDFTGAVEVEIKGSATAEGKVKVADVKPAASIEVEDVVNIELGKANQKISDIVIVEGAVKGLIDDTTVAGGNVVSLDLDSGYRFAKEPKIEVLEGDIDIDVESIDVNNERLTFDVDGQSAKTASKIKLTDVYIDAYRTAPEGPISIEFTAGTNALNETGFTTKSAGKYVIANCVTAALGDTIGNGQFIISSNIYEMNGVKKVMDAAPYIKNARTYVPIRYLGYVLGLTDNDIIWDSASQKVTFTKGDDTVELVIGATTITVNGEAQTMDVAPEISNDRTMLPARYVAEAFGFNVGWDAATQTVLISK